ncbi:DUF6228 family protein [Actinoplanes sp. NBRC 103695]|uniref:DUF6228 family protein n=1 Tax=Actinoplanes sp. NBRC 103695 TaxID=3032202 RepID=UPI0024A36120|nr:DUF6228 family protein [Actinoplanes sp. NBRC 103695]GLY94555.1 hypothetical protein Acsp02_18110 [Actinoplanes sp. NBRC 103695]
MPGYGFSAEGFGVGIRCAEQPDTHVLLHRRSVHADGAGFAVEAVAPGLRLELDAVEISSWDEQWLPDFFAGLASGYAGWSGVKEWRVAYLAVGATFHRGGHVALRWELRPWLSMADSWEGALTTWVEAGEQMRRLAADLDDWLPRPGLG